MKKKLGDCVFVWSIGSGKKTEGMVYGILELNKEMATLWQILFGRFSKNEFLDDKGEEKKQKKKNKEKTTII